jgi:cardiolipin synthase
MHLQTFVAANWGLIFTLINWTICLVMVAVVTQDRHPATASAWLLFIFLFPIIGLVVYLLFGRTAISRARQQQHAIYVQRLDQLFKRVRNSRYRVRPQIQPYLRPIVTLDQNLSHMDILGGNSVELLPDSLGMIKRLAADIDAAQRHVHMVYFEIADDQDGQIVIDALIRVANRGVKCRVLIDAVGAKRFVKRVVKRLNQAGIEAHPALPIHLFGRKASRPDIRNHRKITVIDGRIGYAGSQNLINPSYDKKGDIIWEDLSLRITGPVVQELQAIFLGDWFFETDQWLDTPDLFPEPAPTGTTPVQVLPSGEGYEGSINAKLFTALIHVAEKRVVITTPYFIPSEALYEAMQIAALSEVDVHLILPMRTNSALVGMAAQSYLDALLVSGVHVHFYKPKFLHAKSLSIDGQIAVIGSSNLDLRSFNLDAEISIISYDPAVVERLRVEEARYLANAKTMTLEEWRRRPRWRKVVEDIVRLASPLL